jgi:hypothetical protein
VVGGAVGAGAGGVVGAAIGAGAKKAANLASQYANVYGLLAAEDSMRFVKKQIDSIPKALIDFPKAAPARVINKISDLTRDEKDDNFEELSKKITEAAANPASLDSKLEAVTALSDMGAPSVAIKVTDKIHQTYQYLSEVLPKPLTPNNPLVKSKGFKPSDAELNKFKRQMEAALNPFVIIEDLNNGSLTVEQVQTVDTLYPDIMNRIRESVYDTVAKNPIQVPYNKRLKLSLLLGMDLDPSLEQGTLEILLAEQDAAEQEQANKPSNNIRFTAYPTDVQKISG